MDIGFKAGRVDQAKTTVHRFGQPELATMVLVTSCLGEQWNICTNWPEEKNLQGKGLKPGQIRYSYRHPNRHFHPHLRSGGLYAKSARYPQQEKQ